MFRKTIFPSPTKIENWETLNIFLFFELPVGKLGVKVYRQGVGGWGPDQSGNWKASKKATVADPGHGKSHGISSFSGVSTHVIDGYDAEQGESLVGQLFVQ